MEKKVVRFPVTKVHALPGLDECYMHVRLGPDKGTPRIGWLFLHGTKGLFGELLYPEELRRAKNATVSIEYEVDPKNA